MSTSYALHDATDVTVADTRANAEKGGILKRIVGAMFEARRRQADQEIARYITLNGGVMTDDLERAISRRYGAIVGG